MLPKSLRLGGRERFETIFRSRKAIFGSEIALFFQPSAVPQTRIGFAFKQKAFPKSVTRHFLKRKGNAIMREQYVSLPTGLDIIVLFQRPFKGSMGYKDIESALVSLIKRLNKEKNAL